MKYLGGKTRISKVLAQEILRHASGSFVWEPFCGGLGLTPALADLGVPVIASDIRQELISLYQAVAEGWDPPSTVSEETYRAAKSLPLADPLYAFCAYPCSFGGKRWGGYARGEGRNFADEARRRILSDVRRVLSFGGAFVQCNWLQEEPRPLAGTLYLDPPYRGTTGYGQDFDFDLFNYRAVHWSTFCPVLVSEYDLPIGEVIWTKVRNKEITGTPVEERLYKI